MLSHVLNWLRVTALMSLAGCASPAGRSPAEASGDGGAARPDSGSVEHDAGDGDAGVDTPPPRPESLSELRDLSDFVSLAVAGGEVKYLVAHDTAELPPVLDVDCLFQDTERYAYHLHFLQSLPGLEQLSAERYEDWVMWRATRTMYTGALKLFPAALHPGTGKRGVLVYSVYAAATPDERLTVAEIVEVNSRLAACSGELAALLLYMPQSAAELDFARRSADELASQDVHFAPISQLQTALEAEVYSEGEAYGFLRREGGAGTAEFGPRDVVLSETAPSELGLVAALLTRQPQSVVSHLNLRLQEKRIPNASAPFAFDASVIEQLQNELVHVRAQGGRVGIEPASQQAAEAFWAKQRPTAQTPKSDLAVTTIARLSALSHADAVAYGTKSANLGELIRALPQGNTAPGLALPFAAYQRHVTGNGLESALQQTVSTASKGGAAARAALDELRDAVRDAPISAQFEAELHAAVAAFWGEAGLTTRMRFRSSTNVEDLVSVSGAGLYDSASGCIADDLDADDTGPSHCLSAAQRDYYERELERARAELAAAPERTHLVSLVDDLEKELTREKSARRALRKVWASLWSDRAFEDREYYGIDHERVFMGVTLHPAFVAEQLEAVVITNLEPESEAPHYRVVSQVGEVGVVEPSDPTAVPEQLRFRRSENDTAIDVTLVNPSSLAPEKSSLWSAAAVTELSRLLFSVQDHFEQHVYPEIEPLQLDIEVDVASDGRIVLKQARPYASQ